MTRFLGLDTSSKSVAFSLFNEKGDLLSYGEYYFDGKTTYQKLYDAMNKTKSLVEYFDPDYVCIEEAVRVLNIQTAITMAKFVGAVTAALGENDPIIVAIQPLVWQSFIGNPNLKPEDKRDLLMKNRQYKTKSQQSKFIREYRKQKTITWVKKMFGAVVETDNESDAIAIGYYCSQKLGIDED